jgi:dihydroorotate dehydrogenase electron transfer subunit
VIDETVRILTNREVAEDFYLARLAAPHIAGEALPGQFVNLKVNAGVTPFLRMPLSVCDVNPDAGYIDVLYQEAGPKTQALCKQPIGEELSCLGPLGHPFTHPDKGTDCVLVGGGIGVPPMIFLGRRLMREGFDVALLIGARSAAKHLSDELLEGTALRIGRATDDGSLGHCGLVTDLLRQELESAGSKVVYTCGPHAMIEAVADVSREFDAACQVSLEEYMACGIGICVGCVVRVENADGKTEYGDYKRICIDGPVFDAREICWEH